MNYCWKKMICAALALSSALLIAAEGDQENQRPRRRQREFHGERGSWGERGGRNFRPQGGGMMGRLAKEAEIEAKFKDEYTAVVKQMVEAEKKMAELAKKAKVELPSEMNMVFRQLKLKYPAEFSAIQKKMQSRETMREGMAELAKLAEKENLRLPMMFGMMRPRGGEGGEQPPEPPKMRENPQAQLRKIKKIYPAEWAEIEKLRSEEKHAEAQAKIRELMRKVNEPAAPQKQPEK